MVCFFIVIVKFGLSICFMKKIITKKSRRPLKVRIESRKNLTQRDSVTQVKI